MPFPMHEPGVPPPKKPRGCLFYGCITAVVLSILAVVGGYFMVRHVLDNIAVAVEPYTETVPMQLPTSSMPSAEYEALDQRVTAFGTAMDAGQAEAKLALTADEINALVANHPALAALKGKVHVRLNEDEIAVTGAVPLDDLVGSVPGMSRLKGRFLNGTATFGAAASDGAATFKLRAVEIKGQQLPADVVAELRSHDLLDHLLPRSRVTSAKRSLQSIRIEDGKLSLTAAAKN